METNKNKKEKLLEILADKDFALIILVQHLQLLEVVIDEVEYKEIEVRFDNFQDFCQEKLEEMFKKIEK